MDCFQTVQAKFRDCFQTVRVKILGLFSDGQDRIFGTVFGQSGTWFGFGFDPETDVFGFCGVFWYHSNSMTNREGTKRCHVVYGSEIGPICVLLLDRIICSVKNNMLIYVIGCINMDCMDVNYM